MPWQIAISLSILANAATTLIQRRYSLNSKAPPTFPSAISYLLGVMPVGLLVGFSLPHKVYWSQGLVGLLIICGASMAISGWIGFRAAKLLPIAPYQTIGKFTTIVAIALGWIVLSEKLTLFQSIGALMLLGAAILAIYAPTSVSQGVRKRLQPTSVILALIASTFLAFGLVAEKAILKDVQVGGILIIGWGTQTIAMLLLAIKDVNKRNVKSFNAYEIKWSAFMGLVNGVTGAFYIYSLNKSDNISLISALTATALPLSVFGAHFLLKERDNSKLLWLSVFVCFVGLLVMCI